MVNHIVFFSMNEDQHKANNLQQLKIRLESLPDKIDILEHLEVGLNFSQSPKAADLCLMTQFRTKDDLDTYRTHPAHQEVVEYIKKTVRETRVVDFEN